MTVLFTDLGASTLNGSITNVATSLVIQTADVSKFPASGDFYISVDVAPNVELMHVTAGAGTATWTVTRGITPTSGVAHGSTAPVTEIVSAATLATFIQDSSTTKGDILARSSSALARLAVGTNTYVLTADSTKTLGMDWEAPTGGGGTMDMVRVYQATGTALPAGAFTALSFDTNDTAFTTNAAMHSISTNPTRLIAQVTGNYRLYGQFRLPGSSADTALRFLLNGTATTIGYSETNGITLTVNTTLSVFAEVHLSASDYVELQCYYGSTGTTLTGAWATWASMVRIS